MSSGNATAEPQAGRHARDGRTAVVGIAAAVTLVHLLTNNQYGFHRDELQVLSDALHLDWGFVAYPPLTPFLERMGLGVFGVSLVGLRLFSVITQAVAIVMTGLMARELGGGRLAQAAAALAVALSPLPLFNGTEFQYTSFDFLWWVLTAYFSIRLLKSGNPRWCLAIGAAIGVGMMTKYAIAFYVAGAVTGLLLTDARRFLRSAWFWVGIGVALLIFLPNLVWQARHDFISLDFLRSIHARDVGQGRADGFLRDQFLICTNLFAAALWIPGLFGYVRSRAFRPVAWMYLVPLLLLWVGKGRGYYLAGAYPMLMAMGAREGERWLSRRTRLWRRLAAGTFFAGVAAYGAVVCALILPLSSSGRLRDFALKNNGDLREEIGWNELVQTVAAIRDSLPEEQRAGVGVVAGNYGEQGAIEIFGPAYHLPQPISGTNSAWLRGYPDPPPATLIVLGRSRGYVDRMFAGCRVAGHNANSQGIRNEESRDHADIFVCGGPRLPWPEFWKQFRSFG